MEEEVNRGCEERGQSGYTSCICGIGTASDKQRIGVWAESVI